MLIFSETTAVIITVILLIGLGWRLVLAWQRLRRRREHEHRDDE